MHFTLVLYAVSAFMSALIHSVLFYTALGEPLHGSLGVAILLSIRGVPVVHNRHARPDRYRLVSIFQLSGHVLYKFFYR